MIWKSWGVSPTHSEVLSYYLIIFSSRFIVLLNTNSVIGIRIKLLNIIFSKKTENLFWRGSPEKPSWQDLPCSWHYQQML